VDHPAVASRDLTELPTTAIPAVLGADPVVVLPTGAIEAHGPHLPVSTDYLVAEAVTRAAVARAAAAGLDVWRLPGLAFTKSDEHHWAAGTVWLRWETMMETVVDIGRSLAGSGVTRVAFLNGHGGNSALLQVANRELRRRFGLRTFLLHASVPADQGGESAAGEMGFGVHGGLQETSMVLHLRPDLVDMSTAVRSVPEHLADYRYVGFGRPVSFGWLSSDFGPSGVVGDPTGASAALGAELFEVAVQRAAEALAEVAVFDPAPPR
jgi:creatinine amidohydrolase